VTIAANAGVSGSSGTIYVPSENGTFLTTATSYAGAIAIATSSGNSNIDLTPHGTGEVNISKVDINGGTLAAITIDGNWTAASQTCANLGSVTTADINGGTIDGVTSFNGTVIITSATNNLGIGVDVLNTIGTGDYNVAFGDRALYDLDTGINNTAIGYNAAQNTEADENTVVGYQALNTNISGDANVAVGSNSLHLCSTGEFNVALGTGALYNTTGSNNTAIGRQAGLNITSGSNNICIGEDCRVTTATASNQLNIGDTIYADLSTGDIWTTTTGKIKQKGAFMQHSTNQAWVMGG